MTSRQRSAVAEAASARSLLPLRGMPSGRDHDEREQKHATRLDEQLERGSGDDDIEELEYAAMLEIENDIHARKAFYYIPKEDVSAVENRIQTGDILGITTNVPGLDCSHTGIAVRLSDGRIHFMHASSLKGEVIVSDEPLADYLTHSSHQTGIIVTRPLEVKRIEQ